MRRRALFVMAVVAGLALAACGGTSNSSSGSSTSVTSTTEGMPQSGGTLNIGLDAETNGWNPTSSQWAGAAYYVAQTIFDPLAAVNASGGIAPYLAKSFTHNAAYTVWTIGLRSGISFQNGQPLNAAAVALQLNMCKKSALVGQSLLPMVTAVAVNNLTVRVNMSQPWVAFPAVLAGQPGFIAAPAQLEASAATGMNHPIGTGPFVFKNWYQNSTLTVTKNPHYWRAGLPYVNEIVFHVITDPETRLEALESGQLQYMYTAQASQIKSPPSGFQEIVQHPNEPEFIMLNTDSPPLNNLDLRLALEYATNQQQVNESISLNLATVATGPYAPGSPWYAASGYPTSPDLSKAKQYIADYHAQTHTSGAIKFTLGCTNVSTYEQAMQLVQAQWAQIGVNVNLTTTEQATYIDDAVVGSFQADCWTQFGSVDPDLDATWWLSSNAHPNGQIALNFARLSDTTTDQQLQIGRENPNYATRLAAYGAVWKQFTEQAPYLWLGRAPDALLFSPKVHGVTDGTLPNGGAAYPVPKSGVDTPITQLWLSS